jgi:hypothetical protein
MILGFLGARLHCLSTQKPDGVQPRLNLDPYDYRDRLRAAFSFDHYLVFLDLS